VVSNWESLESLVAVLGIIGIHPPVASSFEAPKCEAFLDAAAGGHVDVLRSLAPRVGKSWALQDGFKGIY